MIHATVARRYAKGLLQAVLSAQATGEGPEEIAQQLERLAQTVERFDDLRRVLVSPAIESAKKAAVLDEVAERLGAGASVRRLLSLLAEKERLDHLGAIATALRRLVDEHLGVLDAEVTTPAPLAETELERLRQRLAAATGREVRLHARTDPSLLGGLLTRIGDVIYDGSLRHQLARIHTQMIEG